MKTSYIIPIAIVAAGAILGGTVYLILKSNEPSSASSSSNPSLVRPIDSSDHIFGNPAAEIKIVEYADFDCEFCKGFDATLHQLVADYGASGKVAWVYRNFALIELHENARKHAEAAECVAEVAGNAVYWKFADSLFENQPVDPTRYAELAKAAGADPSAVASCIQNAATNGIDTRIDADRENALAAGAEGTPYSLIIVSGKAPIVIDGAWGYADLKDALDQALAGT